MRNSIINEHRWEIFKIRCKELIQEIDDNFSIYSLLTSLKSAYSHSIEKHLKEKITYISRELLSALKLKWESHKTVLNYMVLSIYYELSRLTGSKKASIDIKGTWDQSLSELQEGIKLWEEKSHLDPDKFIQWANLLEIIEKNEPDFFEQVEFPEKHARLISQLLQFSEEELNFDIEADDPDVLKSFANDLENLSAGLRTIKKFIRKNEIILDKLIDDLILKAEELNEKALEIERYEPDLEYDDILPNLKNFDVNKLFCDL